MRINKHDTNGTKPLLGKGELGYDDYTAGGDTGRVYVGNGSENIPQAKKSEVVTVDGKIDTHIGRVDNPHTVTKAQVGLGSVDNTADSAKNVLSATKLTTTRNIALTGDVTGSVNFDGSANVSIDTTIAANSVALGTDTTGNYVAGNTAGTGITVTGTAGEGWSPTISIDSTVATLTGAQTLTNKTLQDSTTFIVDNTDATKKVQFDVAGVTTATTRTMTVPNVNGTLVTTGDTGSVTSTMILDGTIVNADINASAGIVDTKLATISTAGKVSNSATTATNLNTASAIVARDASGNFTAGNITAALTGNSSTTTALQTARTLTIGSTGKTFDGTANVSWSVAEIGAQPVDADLTAISALAGTSGLLKKTAADTWTLDTSAYVTSSGVTSVTGTAPIVSSGGNTPAISISAATTSAAGSMSAADKTKLDGIAAGAQVNVATDLSLGTATATTLPLNSSTGTDVTLPAVTTTTAGLMGSADKVKLDGIANNANNYVHPTSGVAAGTYSKVTVDTNGHVTAGLTPTMEDIPDATFKRSVRAATTANITLSAPQTVDGIALVAGDRVLVKDQTTTSQNGIYVVAAGAWTRALDADTASKIASALVAVDSGTVNGGELFDNDFRTTDTLGTTAMLWAFNLDSGSLSSTTPLVAGTATIGTGTTVARADHVHPAQTAITGNAGTATTLQTARTISGVSFNGSANIEIEDRLGTAIASAATTTIGTRGLGDYIHITGVTTITSLGTAAAAGIRRTLIFDGALTLTHNATSLICPGAANIVTVAGTVIEVVAETTANWRVVSITHPSLSMAELGYLDGVTSAIQTQLNAKAALASPALTGTPTAPTAAVGANTTQVATTAFVNAEIANDAVPRVASTDNAIVRFNGITGVVQDSGITIDDSGNVGSGTQSFNGYGGSGFKNLIINGKKVVNQRELTSTNNSYNQDRWYKADNNWFQGIEGDNNLVLGKTYTLSWVGAATASYYVGTATSSTINAQTFTPIVNGGSFTLTISAGQNLWIKFESDTTGNTFNYVQLEEGSVATPFENRPYGLELSLCQRYYEVISMYKWFTSHQAGDVLYTDRNIHPKRVMPTSVLSTNGTLDNCIKPSIVTIDTLTTSIGIASVNAGPCSANGTTFLLSAEL